MKDDNAFFVECPFIDFLRIFPQFVNIIDDSTLNEFMKSNDYIVRYNGSVAEIKYPLFSAVLYRMYPKSLVDESLQSDDYIVRYNGSVLEVGRKSDKWQVK